MGLFQRILEFLKRFVPVPESELGIYGIEIPFDPEQLSKHFNISEFRCKCGCGYGMPKPELLSKLEVLRRRCGDRPIKITSGYRCKKHNGKVGGARYSQHSGECSHGEEGKGWTWGADIGVKGLKPSAVAAIADDLFTGVGRYPSFTHVDVRPGRKVRWGKN